MDWTAARCNIPVVSAIGIGDSMASTTIGTRLYTWFKGEAVGGDRFGNRYYREKGGGKVHPDSLRKERRWVIYDGEVEASRVPPE